MSMPEKSAKRKMGKIHVEIASKYINELIPVWLRCLMCGWKWQESIIKVYQCPKCGSM